MDSADNGLTSLKTNLDHFFLLVNALIIFLMQCGFAFLEAGSVRAKNTTNILLKNLLDVCLGAVAYWGVGYAFAFGNPGNAFIGHNYFFFGNIPDDLLSHFFFHFVFAATAATIVSGAMAERTDFKAYMIYSVVITGFVYPIVSHWAWDGNGWLYQGVVVRNETIGYQDFAGSSVVHMVGGLAALVGAAILGPRKGRFDKNNEEDFSGHTVPLVALGGFILFFGFFAFNGGSQAAISNEGDGVVVAIAIVNTIISGSAAALVALALGKFLFRTKKWSLLTSINGGLTGMVAICAGCNSVYAWGAFVTGLVAGIVYIVVSALMVKLRIDDPLDAVAVHFGGGLWGIVSVPIFARGTGILFRWNAPAFGGFGWNLLGALVISLWTSALSILLFGALQLLHLLRVDPETEEKGLDLKEHGEPAYPLMAYVGHDGKFGLPNGHGLELAHMEEINVGYVKDTELDVTMATKEEASQVV
ncbi:Ammonium transporter 1 member 2 [Holothuria leucospilota]|uniref:Ammonium transporter n=1 Tax=Holothuria leucospilota TaxID=206669 RepID=A0A9Q1BDG0_HOLLE|nr:Ammonium transporter 1 member 2 [Holothuria leucospilota]